MENKPRCKAVIKTSLQCLNRSHVSDEIQIGDRRVWLCGIHNRYYVRHGRINLVEELLEIRPEKTCRCQVCQQIKLISEYYITRSQPCKKCISDRARDLLIRSHTSEGSQIDEIARRMEHLSIDNNDTLKAPFEILDLIFSYLTPTELVKCMLVCKRWCLVVSKHITCISINRQYQVDALLENPFITNVKVMHLFFGLKYISCELFHDTLHSLLASYTKLDQVVLFSGYKSFSLLFEE